MNHALADMISIIVYNTGKPSRKMKLGEVRDGVPMTPMKNVCYVTRGVQRRFWRAVAGFAACMALFTLNAFAQPAGISIDLREAISRALLKNPGLAAFDWKVRAAEARALQAGLRKNPELSLEIEDVRWKSAPGSFSRSRSIQVGGTAPVFTLERGEQDGASGGVAEAQFTLRLSQIVELGGKRVKRMHLAARERDLAQWDYESARLDVLVAVVKSFVETLSAQERLAVASQTVALAEKVVATVTARVEAGSVSPIEQTKAETEVAAARVAEANVLRDLRTARTGLAATWNATTPDFDSVSGKIEDIILPPPRDDLLKSIEKNPDLARWSSEMEMRHAALQVQSALRVPDVTLMAGWRRTGLDTQAERSLTLDSTGLVTHMAGEPALERGHDDALVFGVAVPLPLFDRNQGGIAEAECNVSASEQERQAALIKTHAALSAAWEAWSGAYHAAVVLRDDIVPRARDVFDRTEEGYRLGKFGYLEVLDAQRVLFDMQTQYFETLTTYHLAAADVERLAGAPAGGILEDAPKSAPVLEDVNHGKP